MIPNAPAAPVAQGSRVRCAIRRTWCRAGETIRWGGSEGRTLRRQLTGSDVASQHEAEVLSGGLEPGTKLPSERELALRLGVSRPLVREALRSLVERGLVEISPGRGAFVRLPRPPRRFARSARTTFVRTSRRTISSRCARSSSRPPRASRLTGPRDTEIAALGHAVEQIGASTASSTAHAGTSRCTPSSPGCPTTRSSRRPSNRSPRSSSSSCSAARSDPKVDRGLGAVPPGDLRGDSRPRPGPRLRARCLPTTRAGSRLFGDDLDASLDAVARRELERLLGPSASLEQIVARGDGTPRAAADGRPRARLAGVEGCRVRGDLTARSYELVRRAMLELE